MFPVKVPPSTWKWGKNACFSGEGDVWTKKMVLLKIYTWRDEFQSALALYATDVESIKVSAEKKLVSVRVRLLLEERCESCSFLAGTVLDKRWPMVIEILGAAPVVERIRPVARKLAGTGWFTMKKLEF